MNIRFSPFKSPKVGPAEDLTRATMHPIDQKLVPKSIDVPKRHRRVTIVHPSREEAYRLKSQLLNNGHRHIDTFFLPESFLSVVREGHRPHVVFVHDFMEADTGMTGVELVRRLRLEHALPALILSTSPDHAGIVDAVLEIHGFSGHASSYLKR